jgi:hypothetical protein
MSAWIVDWIIQKKYLVLVLPTVMLSVVTAMSRILIRIQILLLRLT